MFFKVLLVVIGLYFLFKMIFKSLFSRFLGGSEKKVNHQFRQQQEKMAQQKKKEEGHVTVHYQPKPEKTFGKDDGVYVDFEELK